MSTLYEYYNTGDDDWAEFYGVIWIGQTFTPAIPHYIVSVKLLLYRAGNPGTITVGIRNTVLSGGVYLPTGNDLTSGTYDGNSLTTDTAGQWVEITLTSYILTVNSVYAIVARATAATINNRVIRRDDASSPSYTGGMAVESENSGSTWVSDSQVDMMFEEWGNPAFIPKVFII